MEAERCLTAAEIYQQLTGGAGAESLGSTQRAALRLSERLQGVAERVAGLAQYQRAAWHGESANEASANSCTPLMRAAMDDSLHLGIAQGAADDQLSAFQNAKNSVQPVAAEEPVFTDQDVVDLLRGDGRKYTDRMSQWQADSQHNVQVFDGYSSSTGSNNIRVPARYSQLQDTGAQVSLAGADGSSADSVAGPGPGGGGDGKPRTGHGTGSPGAMPVTPGPAPTPDPVPAPGPAPTPGPVRQPVGRPIPPPGSGLRPIDRGDDTTRKDSWPSPGPVPPAPGPRYRPGPPLIPIDLGQRSDGGSGPVGYSPVGTGSGGVGREPGSRGGVGAGSRTGVGAPGEPMQARGGGAAGVPGVAGKNGAAMGGGMPGKGGKGEEDKEKKAASYLREADPDGLFGGSDLKPTPPVIGELPRR